MATPLANIPQGREESAPATFPDGTPVPQPLPGPPEKKKANGLSPVANGAGRPDRRSIRNNRLAKSRRRKARRPAEACRRRRRAGAHLRPRYLPGPLAQRGGETVHEGADQRRPVHQGLPRPGLRPFQPPGHRGRKDASPAGVHKTAVQQTEPAAQKGTQKTRPGGIEHLMTQRGLPELDNPQPRGNTSWTTRRPPRNRSQ